MAVDIFAYDADGRDVEIELERLDQQVFGDHRLVWIDVSNETCATFAKIAERLHVDPESFVVATRGSKISRRISASS